MESKVLTPAIWESFIQNFNEPRIIVDETIGCVTVEDNGEQEARDNGRVEAILDLRVIEEHLRQLTYVVLSLWRRINWLAMARKRLPDLGWMRLELLLFHL